MKINKWLLAPVLVLAVSACDVNSKGQYNTTTGPDRVDPSSQVDATQVQVFEGKPDRSFQAVGPIDVDVNKLTAFHPNPTRADAVAALKEEAAERGANGVIDM
ncbi:MAG: hypothetical protein AAGA05_11645, partial [Pseudomonadota bacterium]